MSKVRGESGEKETTWARGEDEGRGTTGEMGTRGVGTRGRGGKETEGDRTQGDGTTGGNGHIIGFFTNDLVLHNQVC